MSSQGYFFDFFRYVSCSVSVGGPTKHIDFQMRNTGSLGPTYFETTIGNKNKSKDTCYTFDHVRIFVTRAFILNDQKI